jgi:lysophospholipase L1-like esterase
MKNYITALIVVQLVVIVFLGIQIRNKKVLGSISVTPIESDSVVVSSDVLKFFYEPRANSKEVNNPELPLKRVENTINSDSLNEHREYLYPKPPNTIRIITLGDSFTYGAYVPTPQNWTEVLEDRLQDYSCSGKKIEVINLGVGGYDLQYSTERFKIRGNKYEPDLVVWFVIENDFKVINELFRGLESEIRKEMESSGEYMIEVNKGNFYPSYHKALESFVKRYSDKSIIDQLKHILREFNTNYQGKLVMMTEPSLSETYKNIVQEFVEGRDLGFYYETVDLNSNPELVIPKDGHPSVLGHAAIANDLYAQLTENNMLPCN